MNRFKRIIMWLALVAVVTLIVLSVYSAFIGAGHAKALFNSIALQIFWFVLLFCLITSLIVFPRFTKAAPIALIHVAGILVLIGGMWSSVGGHCMQRSLFKNDKYQAGRIIVEKGKMQNKMVLKNYKGFAKLPFRIALEDFTIEYYESDLAQKMPRDYFSDVKVIENSRAVASKKIEVNKPLHYGGYYFLQQDYGNRDGNPYTVLDVVSDSGISLVFGGYIFLCAGLFWQLWPKALKRGAAGI